ncbi:MAG TPA: hypothetical protein DCR97_02525 [Deltaproteobacteria bacterium]|nr:hypothetical protein [Deltaproteobacteria bacterium]
MGVTNEGMIMKDSEMAVGRDAPDFELADSEGRQFRLSNYKGARNVFLVFNRGFG